MRTNDSLSDWGTISLLLGVTPNPLTIEYNFLCGFDILIEDLVNITGETYRDD